MNQPKRKQNRLDGYDYASVGAYFVTICTKDRKRLFWCAEKGEVSDTTVGAIIGRPTISYRLSDIGEQVKKAIDGIPTHYNDVYVDCYCIMPDHVHLIVCILPPDILFANNDGRPMIAPTNLEVWRLFADGCCSNPNLSRIINQFKGIVAKQAGVPIWQKSFYDRIIRNDTQMKIVRRYIAENPLRWQYDSGGSTDLEVFIAEKIK